MDHCCYHCSNYYEDPRVLSCLHSICFKCVQSLQQENSDVVCPCCSNKTSLPQQEKLELLPKNIKLKKAVEQEQLLSKITGITLVKCNSCESYCTICYCFDCGDVSCGMCWNAHQRLKQLKSHVSITFEEAKQMKRDQLISMLPMPKVKLCQYHEQTLDIFCEQCDVLVCEECLQRIHKDHVLGDLRKEDTECKKQIKQSNLKMQTTLENVEATLYDVEEARKSLYVEKEKIVENMAEAFATIHKVVEMREKVLLSECSEAVSTSDNQLTTMTEGLKKMKENVKESISIASIIENQFDGYEIIEVKDVVRKRSRHFEQDLATYSLNTKGIAHQLDTDKVVGMLSTFGSISEIHSEIASCSLETVTGNKTTPTTTEGTVHTENEISQSNIIATRSKAMKLALDSSFIPLKNFQSVCQRFNAVTQISGISSPRSLAFSINGDIFVTSNNHYVSVFRKTGKTLFSTYAHEKFGEKKNEKPHVLCSPVGISVDEGIVYITGADDMNGVHIFFTNGDFIKVMEQKESGRLVEIRDGLTPSKDPSNPFVYERSKSKTLSNLGDIKISPDKRIYIADVKNCCVLVYRKDWSLSHKILYQKNETLGSVANSYSSCSPESPHGICFDQLGFAHILWSSRSPSVTVHDSDGQFIRGYGNAYASHRISGIAIDSCNYSFIIDDNYSLHVYAPDGTKSCNIDKFNCSRSVVSTCDGKIWIADTNNGRLATLEFQVTFS